MNAVRNEFDGVVNVVEMALGQERRVTDEITTLVRVARDEGDYIGEQFMQWFLREQVEEMAQMNTLLTVARRAGGNLFELETYLAREHVGPDHGDADSPRVAGGAI